MMYVISSYWIIINVCIASLVILQYQAWFVVGSPFTTQASYANTQNKNNKLKALPIDLGKERGLRQDTELSQENVQKILTGVENGNKDSIYYFGLLKLYGIVLSKSESVAASSIKRAAELGHVEATTAYGVLLLHGIGVSQDTALASAWLRKGVQLNDGNAHWLLGQLLMENPNSGPDKHREAISLFRFGAELHIPQAEHLLAVMYEYGLGVEQDFSEAITYYRKAADQSYVEAMYNLGIMYCFGRGMDQDYHRALSLFERAAEIGHAPAMHYLGVIYLYGYGIMPDYDVALSWFERASAMGDIRVSEQAAKAVKEITELMAIANKRNNEVMDRYRRMAEDKN